MSTNYIPQKFFKRDSHVVAHELLGQKLCRRIGKNILKFTVSEVEVYDGYIDKASHAHGKKSNAGRSRVMFSEAGNCYVYLCYGVHWMLNIVTREKGYPAAILIRGCREISGPGRLTRQLKINRRLNEKIASPEAGLWFEFSKHRELQSKCVVRLPRVGINYAGAHWARKPYRYLLKSSSPKRQ